MIELNTETITTLLAIYGGITVLAIWVGMIVWTYRDIRTRSRDNTTHLLSTGVVTLLNIAGLFLYLFLRPKETLTETYERSLEEEALLQEIEEQATCPGCGQHIHEDWQICPHCHTQLKKVCIKCRSLIEIPWSVCPYCTTPQPSYQQEVVAQAESTRITTRRSRPTIDQTIDFIEDEEY
jgi:RNA polymerase subunit RPABC4/transcription elongation factor Spt4